jgi:hypothetical protein
VCEEQREASWIDDSARTVALVLWTSSSSNIASAWKHVARGPISSP